MATPAQVKPKVKRRSIRTAMVELRKKMKIKMKIETKIKTKIEMKKRKRIVSRGIQIGSVTSLIR